MKKFLIAVGASAALLLSACAHHSAYENEAEKITKAMQANTLASVSNDLNPDLMKKITRIQVAEISSQFAPLGNIKDLKDEDCPVPTPGYHCVHVTFDNGSVDESVLLDNNNKVDDWRYHNLTTTK